MKHVTRSAADGGDDELGRQQRERRSESDDEREEHDVAGGRATRREELRVLPEQVEEGLRERKPRRCEELGPTSRRQAQPTPPGHARELDAGHRHPLKYPSFKG